MKYNRYPKRDAIKDYFPLPNEVFCLNLSYGEIAVYSYLLYREKRKNFQCYPSYKTIGKALKMSRNTVCKYVRQLEEKELITTESTSIRTARGEKRNGNLLYTILPIEQAKKHFYDWQLENIDQVIADEKRRKRMSKMTIKILRFKHKIWLDFFEIWWYDVWLQGGLLWQNADHQATEWFASAMMEDGKDESLSVTRAAANQYIDTFSPKLKRNLPKSYMTKLKCIAARI